MFHTCIKKFLQLVWGLEDFAFGLADSDLCLSDKQVAFLEKVFLNIQMTEVLLVRAEIF